MEYLVKSQTLITRNWPAVTAKPEIITVFAFASCPIGPKKIRTPKQHPAENNERPKKIVPKT